MAFLVFNDTILKRTKYVENILKSTSIELEQEFGYLRRLETWNAKMKAKIKVCKLSALEFNVANLQIEKMGAKGIEKM